MKLFVLFARWSWPVAASFQFQWQCVSVDQFTGNKKSLIEALPVSNSCPKCLVEWLPVCDIKVAHNGGTLCAQPASLFLLFRCDNISSTESVPQTFVSLLFRFPLNLARRLKSWSRKSRIRIAMLLTDSRFYSVLQNTDELTVTIYYLVKYQGGVTGPNFFSVQS